MKKIVVTGDVSVDHNIYRGVRRYPGAPEQLGSKVDSSIGGFYLLHDLLHSISEQTQGEKIEVSAGIAKPEITDVAEAHHGYALWKPCERDKETAIWYVDELLGYGEGNPQKTSKLKTTPANNSTPDILVIDDAALGFRFQKKLWPEYINDKNIQPADIPKKLVLKMSYPVMQGDLWDTLAADPRMRGRLILLVSAEDLRRGGLLISRGGSWEKSVQELVAEIKTSSVFKDLPVCAHLIVTFKSEAAFSLSNPGKSEEHARFVFDPGFLEGQWVAKAPGDVIGYGACLAAGIVRSLLLEEKSVLAVGVEQGLAATRDLLQHGYGQVGAQSSTEKKGFPLEFLSEKSFTSGSGTNFSCVDIDITKALEEREWSVLGEWAGGSLQPLYGVAREVARYGTTVLKSMPYGEFGKLLTVDRKEIESLNSIRQLIEKYVANDPGEKPLSIGVFGPPGSGKSFGIKQIVKGIVKDCEILEYNLSQYATGPGTLISLLHCVRDVVLQGRLPIVFWDEFDSQELTWLQYLLAPMQDGCFLDGNQMHPLGKCVFVFAGGTAHTMTNFTPADRRSEEYKKFTLKKGPDFVSRLRGYLNVLGPNQRTDDKGENDATDIFFPIRRAILLRSIAGVFGNKELKIDTGLLSAFIQIPQYNHGARSLETIIKLMPGSVRHGFLRSDVPPREQIGIHVNYDQFCSIIKRDVKFQRQCVVLAPIIHTYYSEKFPEGVHASITFEDLPPEIKQSNVAAALRIPHVLALAGLKLVSDSGKGKQLAKDVKKRLDENIEKLAEAEHNGWMEYLLLNGWQLGERDDATKRHNCLIAYSKLTDGEKDKDREAILNYPAIIKNAGFAIKLESGENAFE